MRSTSTPMNAAGFVLAPLSILLMWLDIPLPYPWIMLFLFFVLLPFARWAWPIDMTEEVDETQIPRWMQTALYWLPSAFALIWLASALLLPFLIDFGGRSALQVSLLWISVWITASLTLPASHELIHRQGIEALLGRLLGAASGLVVFSEEHRVHHAKSGRGQDPDCAEQHENVFAYSLRTARDSFWAGWDYEVALQMRKGRSPWSNRIVWTSLVTAALAALWAAEQGLRGLLFYITIALAANFSLRAITFIQHWGLRQVPLQVGGNGVSWVSTCIFQSWIIFNLALHEHHHQNPSRPYWKLRAKPTDLKLPVSYPISFLMSLVPPLYRKVMGPRLAQWLDSATQGEPMALKEGCLMVSTH